MRLSRQFLPTLRETPSDAQIVSHQLMLRAGLVRQTAAGIYAWLPLGLRVMDNIARIVREEQAKAGALEVLMPTIQAADLWRESGRYDAYGPEMLRLKDRHNRDLLYSPTAEELFTRVFADGARSWRDCPAILYQIQWKFRDEVRPRFGVMRGREFYMKDGYSFDLDEAAGRHSYQRMMLSYLKTFARMGLHAIPMRAPTGPIGGDLSHEFVILADSGESEVFFHRRWRDARDLSVDPDDAGALGAFFAGLAQDYAATDELRDEAAEAAAGDALQSSRGIEVGHIFFFGDKYTRAAGVTLQGRDGKPVTPVMGSYGIGVSRLVGAAIEASHDEAGIIWPDAIAPYRLGIVNLRAGDAGCDAACDQLHRALGGDAGNALLDDTDARGGEKFARMDLIGLPWVATVGPKGVAAGTVELKRRATGERHELSIESALAKITA